jgi:hypothetical protein
VLPDTTLAGESILLYIGTLYTLYDEIGLAFSATNSKG